jgi:hypothetical protein
MGFFSDIYGTLFYNYKAEFLNALNFSNKKLNTNLPTDFKDGKIFTDAVLQQLPNSMFNKFGVINIKDVSANCLTFNYNSIGFFREFLKCEVYYTIGWLFDPNKKAKLFYTDRNILIEHLNSRMQPTPLKLETHAWLTLPTMEIIDLTFQTSLVKLFNSNTKPGSVIIGYPWDKNIPCRGMNIKYHPQIIVDTKII